MKSAALASIAILKVNWDRLGRDYLDTLLPFVLESIRLSPDDVISLPDTQRRIHDSFGLNLGLNVIRTLLNRAAKANYVTRTAGVLRRNPAHDLSSSFEQVRQSVLDKYGRVSQTLATFARDKHGLNWTDEDAEGALLKFLSANTMQLIFASVDHTALELPPAPANSDYVVGGYIAEVRTSATDQFADIETLLKGFMLSNALFLPDIAAAQQRFSGTRGYFDSLLLNYAAGNAGADRQAPVLELLRLLRDNGGVPCCFEKTVDEARGALDACAHRIRNNLLRDAYGPSIEYFIETGQSASDIDLLSARLPQQLESLGFRIEPLPPYETIFQVDEPGFQKALQAAVHYHKEKALIHDIDAVSGIARIRRGHDSTTVERSLAIFVTPNVLLAKTTKEFFQPDAPPGAVALCISDHALATILWLKNPTLAPDLPTKRLIADAFAALQPSLTLWKLYLVEISHLQEKGVTSSDEYYVLRHAQAAKRALMDITLGDPATFTEGTVSEVLAVAKDNISADVRESLAREKEERAAVEHSLATLQSARAVTQTRVGRYAHAVGRGLAISVFAIVAAFLGIGAVTTFPWSLPAVTAAWSRYLLGIGQAALLLFTLAGLFFGTSLKRLMDKLEAAVSDGFRAYIGRKLGLHDG